MICCRCALPCASRDAGLDPDVAKRNRNSYMDVAWASCWKKAGAGNFVFSGKVARAGDERYLVCVCGGCCGRTERDWFLLCVLQ